MVSLEDFSFPKIKNPTPHFTSLPSLWRVSSLVYPECGDEDDDVEGDKVNFSYLEGRVDDRPASNSTSNDVDKMDMLWEDFNEELIKEVSNSSSRIIKADQAAASCISDPPSAAAVEVRHARPLEMSKAVVIGSGRMICHKRHVGSNSKWAVAKTLKKVLFLGNLVKTT